MFNDNFCVYLDAGHGGIDPQGRYVTAPAKQFKHNVGTFHNGGWIYEGVFNRTIVQAVSVKLTQLGINHLIVSHEYLDMGLAYRVDQANWYHRNYKRGVFISSHANASPQHNARGLEVYTSRGRTKADSLATLYWDNAKELLGTRVNFRADRSDGDNDKEANFYVLKNTAMPAILIEHLFFDNYQDAILMMDDAMVERFAEAQVRTVIEYMNRYL